MATPRLVTVTKDRFPRLIFSSHFYIFCDSVFPALNEDSSPTAMATRLATQLRPAVRSFRSYTLRSFSSSALRFEEKKAEKIPKPPPPIEDSTSALAYKYTHSRPAPLPATDLPRSRTAEEAVTNILYNTPPPSLQPFKKFVQLTPGLLA